ncbi:MAG: M23 family metallopeptidase [Polyangiaceae bacterium]|nr:M23 family metallopeptidase [Polyangiaceae bacterium]
MLGLVACGPSTAGGASASASASTSANDAPAPAASVTTNASAEAATSASGAAPPAASASSGPQKADPSRFAFDGKVIQGGTVFAKVDGKVGRIDFPGHRAVVSDEGEFPIAFSRNEPKSVKMVIHFKDGTALEHAFEVEQRTYETDKIDGLPPNMVKLDPKTQKQHDEVEKRIDAVRKKYSKKNFYKDGFIWPTTGKVTSRYGQPRILNGTDAGIHWGIDIAVPVGTPIKAPACGTVIFAEANVPLAGSTLVIDHGHGLTSTFIHLGRFSKKVGDEVKQGDVVAASGNTGRTNGAHLDWRMNYFEVRVDPEQLVPPMPGAK